MSPGAARPRGEDEQMEDAPAGEIGAEREQAGEARRRGWGLERGGCARIATGGGEVYQGSDEDSLYSEGAGAESDGGGSPGVPTRARRGALLVPVATGARAQAEQHRAAPPVP